MKRHNWKTETITLVETQLDDITGQEVGYLIQKLLQKGALDAICIPILMKKGRPGFLFQVLCYPKDKNKFCEFLFDETPALGVRFQSIQRHILRRNKTLIQTSLGKLHTKEKIWKNTKKSVLEFEDLVSLSQTKNIPVKEIRKLFKK